MLLKLKQAWLHKKVFALCEQYQRQLAQILLLSFLLVCAAGDRVHSRKLSKELLAPHPELAWQVLAGTGVELLVVDALQAHDGGHAQDVVRTAAA